MITAADVRDHVLDLAGEDPIIVPDTAGEDDDSYMLLPYEEIVKLVPIDAETEEILKLFQ